MRVRSSRAEPLAAPAVSPDTTHLPFVLAVQGLGWLRHHARTPHPYFTLRCATAGSQPGTLTRATDHEARVEVDDLPGRATGRIGEGGDRGDGEVPVPCGNRTGFV